MKRVVIAFDYEDDGSESEKQVVADCFESLMGGDYSAKVKPLTVTVGGVESKEGEAAIMEWFD